jgi:methylated-DNA-protein-cysteine methyltransferase related protein
MPHPPKSAAPFRERVYAMVRSVPRGRVASYGDIAALVGTPRAARGVGAALQSLETGTDVPWWRIVNRSGRLTIPADHGLRALQRTLLERERVRFTAAGEVDLERHHWRGPGTADS